jgi:glycerol-3-phosphate dehydrogenase
MNKVWDALVIGGGITGAGVLRDLSLRGVKALLIEKGRPAHGTTINSSHLIHGGLRYMLYDRLTTHATCWDSGHIVRLFRPFLTRLPIVWPVYRGHSHGLETVETLLEGYDRFSRMKYGLTHQRLSADTVRRIFPALSIDGLLGGVVFDEWWVDPEALVKANLESALRSGGDVWTGAEATALLRKDGLVSGAAIRRSDGSVEDVSARLVVNAAGPWVDRVSSLAGLKVPLRLRQGTHLVYGTLPFLSAAGRPVGLLLEAEDRGRYVFVLPTAGTTLVGPTDVATDRSPDDLRPTEEEKRYLLSSVRRYFPAFPDRYDRTLVGARPILGQAASEKLLSREFEVFDHGLEGAPGFLTVAGGKMSDFRLMGEAVGNAVTRLLGRSSPCLSHRILPDGSPLPSLPEDPRPSPFLKRFLRRHPRLREAHALAYLGGGLLRHALHPRREASLEEFLRHYA